MTLLPAHDGQSLSLVCDTCGTAVTDIESPTDTWPVVWAVIRRTGWSGSPVPIGPHHCPQCHANGEPRATRTWSPSHARRRDDV